MEYSRIIKKLKSMSNKRNAAKMAGFGINPDNTLGISVPVLRKIAKKTGKDHALALQLWDSGIHEARILASLVDDPKKVKPEQMEKWAMGFDSWDVCDMACSSLFSRTKYAFQKAVEWAGRSKEYVRRAGFVLMAVIAWFRIDYTPAKAKRMFKLIEKYSADPRNFVKKAISWALRNMGKSGTKYRAAALRAARRLEKSGIKPAVWIAKDAIRELENPAVIKRAGEREQRFKLET